MTLNILKPSRAFLYTFAVLAAVPPALLLWKAEIPQQQQQVAAMMPKSEAVQVSTPPPKPPKPLPPPPELPETFSLPDGYRVEVPRRPVVVLPVRLADKFNSAKNPELFDKLKSHNAQDVLTGEATVDSVSEFRKPFGAGLLIDAHFSANVAKGNSKTTRVRLYAVLPEPVLTRELQSWADGGWLKTLDLANINALPFLCSGDTLFCVVASNQPYSRAWDWEVESARLKKLFASRIGSSKTPQEHAEIVAEMKTKTEEGYDLKWDWSVESAKLKRDFAARIQASKTPEEDAAIKAEMKMRTEQGYDLK